MVIVSTRDSASSGTLSFWVRACVLSRGSLHFACFLLNSCSSSKLKGHREYAGFDLLRDPLFLAAGIRKRYRNLHFACFLFNSCSSSKVKGHREHAGFGLPRDPLFLAAGMRKRNRNLDFVCFFYRVKSPFFVVRSVKFK